MKSKCLYCNNNFLYICCRKRPRKYCSNTCYLRNYNNFKGIFGTGWKTIRKEILKRDKFVCQICSGVATEVHHKDGNGSTKPKKERNNKLDNLIAVCHRCNIMEDLKLWGTTNFSKGSWTKEIERNKNIVEMWKSKSLSEISRLLGITRQRVHQIVKRDLKKV